MTLSSKATAATTHFSLHSTVSPIAAFSLVHGFLYFSLMMPDPVIEGSASAYVYSRFLVCISRDLIPWLHLLCSVPGISDASLSGLSARLVPAQPGNGLNSLDVPGNSA